MSAVLPVWLSRSGFRVFTRPYELNLVGFRANSVKSNSFDDILKVFFWDEKKKYHEKTYKITTDPGTFWLKNPMNDGGTAMLAAGQYIDLWALGMHKGQYRALVQVGECTVFRDYNRDAKLDFLNGNKQKGFYGINMHKAKNRTLKVDKWSAGCQVFKEESDYDKFIELAEIHAERYGKFTYTLFDERMFTRTLLRRLGVVLGMTGIFYIYKKVVK